MGSRFVRGLRLERFSAEFAKALLARHPEWQAYFGAYEVEEDGFQQRYLEVRVPPPNPNTTEPLLIRTLPEEIYLEWAGLHDHIYTIPGVSDEDEDALFARALQAVDRWTSEDYSFHAVYREGHVVEAAGVRAEERPRWFVEPKPGDRVVIRSWRGTHDEERVVEP